MQPEQQNKLIQQKKQSSPPRFTWLVAGMMVGATAAYFFDPARGNYRRSTFRDRFFRLSHRTELMALRFFHDIQNRVQGGIYRWQHPLNPEVDDQTLESRVRSEFGRLVRHAKAIVTEVQGGVVTLSGPILSDEVRPVIRCVRSLPGVKKVINNLQVRQQADSVPGLQGEGKQYLQ